MADERWYIIHTYSGYEEKVMRDILKTAETRGMTDEIIAVNIPKEDVYPNEDSESRASVDALYADSNGSNDFDDDAAYMASRKAKAQKPRIIFPGYVFVKVAVTAEGDKLPTMSDETWQVIRNTRGVTAFLGPDGKPIPMTREETIQFKLEAEDAPSSDLEDELLEAFNVTREAKVAIEEAGRKTVDYAVGDTVDVTDGPFEGFSGTVLEIDIDNDVVKISVSFFGKETPVELQLDKVKLPED